MSDNADPRHLVAVVGAGPAGLYAAKHLAAEGVHAVLFNRDIKPGGLAEYGIYPTKHRMKEGLRRQFRQILELPNLEYYGNLTVSRCGEISLEQLQSLGFQAVLVTVGAQGTKWLGLPGEDLEGVYHAKDLVYHYNKLPPFSGHEFKIGRKVALIGVGNVMVDVAHWLVRELKVEEVIAVARRGPAEVKFDKKEFEVIARNLDVQALDRELERVAGVLKDVNTPLAEARDFILSALEKAPEPVSETRFRFDFLASPVQILGDEAGRVRALEVEETVLIPRNGGTKAQGLGIMRPVEVDTVIFCIGDRVDSDFGLPVQWNEFAKNPQPRFPVEDLSYEAFDLETEKPLEGIFLAGWARKASSGLVGTARKDGVNGAKAVLAYLASLEPRQPLDLHPLHSYLQQLDKVIVDQEALALLEAAEQAEAERLGLEEYKFATNEEMLAAIGLYQMA